MVYDYLKSIMPKKFEKNYYPYFAMLFVYLVIANLSGLIGFEAPTSNYSITLALTTITFCLIQFNAIKKQGLLSYIWGAVWPPTNLLSILSPLISLSMRLFGNILSGSILMYLVYQFTGFLSSFIINFNFLGPIIAPVLHCYFDIFSGCIQTLVFVTLSSILIMMENPD
ncbi:MAG: F0F1 ATP synthase subunit A [Faecalibacillus faecis]